MLEGWMFHELGSVPVRKSLTIKCDSINDAALLFIVNDFVDDIPYLPQAN